MPPPVRFTKPYLDKLLRQKPEKQELTFDTKQKGLCVVHSNGGKHKDDSTVTFSCCHYLPGRPGAPLYVKIGRYPEKTFYRDMDGVPRTIDCGDLEAVRLRCSEIRNAAKIGINPRQPSLGSNAEEMIEAYAKDMLAGKKSAKELHRVLQVYVLPEWKNRRLEDIRRSEVSQLLRKIEGGKFKHEGKLIGTPNVAGSVLTQISCLFDWFVVHHAPSDDYTSPIVKGMAKKNWAAKERDRVLDTEEIRALWQATAEMGTPGYCVRIALLTAQRFYKVAEMRRSQIEDGIWDAVNEDDPKNKQVSIVPLTPFAASIIDAVPIVDAGRWSADFVFSVDGKKPYNGWSVAKATLDKKLTRILGHEIDPWQFRDLRRTASTLMNSLGVDENIVERCLAHKLGGVKGVYNRHSYTAEKRVAFTKLSDLIESIVAEEAAPKKIERIRLRKIDRARLAREEAA